jgi:hypothetical protein
MQLNKICLLLCLLFISAVCVGAQIEQASAKKIKIYALRLRPGQDLRIELENLRRKIRSAQVLL